MCKNDREHLCVFVLFQRKAQLNRTFLPSQHRPVGVWNGHLTALTPMGNVRHSLSIGASRFVFIIPTGK